MIKRTNEILVQAKIKESKESEKDNSRLRDALIRAGAAFLAAVVLLSLTSFSFINLLKGPKDTISFQNEEIGSFVKCKVYAILGDYSNGQYALVPMDGKLVTVHFTKRYLKSVDTIKTETQNYINGIAMFDKYVLVQGTVEKLDEDHSTQMYEWFDKNKDWMVEKQVIADSSDYSDYLTDTVLTVDTVNSLNQALVFLLTGLAALLLLYDIVELILMAAGFYLDKPKKEIYVDNALSAEEINEIIEDKTRENANKCINSKIDSENTDSPDVKEKDGVDEPEDKE